MSQLATGDGLTGPHVEVLCPETVPNATVAEIRRRRNLIFQLIITAVVLVLHLEFGVCFSSFLTSSNSRNLDDLRNDPSSNLGSI